MIFTTIVMVLVLLIWLTIRHEHRRARSLTPLSLLSVGNLVYNAVTPIIFYYSPSSAIIFELYVFDSGMVIQEAGLIRVILAATVFQVVCLGVSFGCGQNKNLSRSDAINDMALVKAAFRVGLVMLLIGGAGVIWMGLIYNGHPWGLYEISYFERSALSRENSVPSFMLLLGIYGASQLIVVAILTDRLKIAVLILLAITLHGLGMKSKFPVFWILIVFLIAAIGRKKYILRLLLPISFSALILSTMSILRGVEDWSDIPRYVEMYWDLLGDTMATPWENDLPGPASMSYFIINNPKLEYTVEPIIEAFKLLIPKFVFDRGPVLADVWAEKMLGSQYEPGLGFGWSPICDGYLLGGLLGVALVAFMFARLARYIDDLRAKGDGRMRDFFVLVGYTSAPFFLYGIRESTGGLIKQMLLLTILIWLPTLFLLQKSKLRTSKVRTS